MQHHWVSDHETTEKHEQSPFMYPPCSQTLAHLQWWKAQKKKKLQERRKRIFKDQQNHKILQFSDILQKLHINVEINKKKYPDKTIAMTDVDPQYFTELSGRPVQEKFLSKPYIQNIREILKMKYLIGQEKDDYIRIDQQFEEESRRLQKIQYYSERYISGFEKLLSKDHEKSMNMLKQADQEVKLTEVISTQSNELSKQFGQRRLDVYFWEENWRIVKMCQIFLYWISPISWKIKHDWLSQFDSARSIVSIDATNLFEKYKTPPEDASLEELIELFEQDVSDAGSPELYFEDPYDLIRIFRAMETQNLNALTHLESLAAPMADMTMTITATEIQIKQEIDEITSTINDLESSIHKTEDRAAKLEEHANYLLRNVFRRLVCSEEVLYLRVFVEDTYESCVGPNDANLDSFSMMKWIEKIHEDLNHQLDNLPREVVRACEKEGFRQETKAIKEAENAAKKFQLMHRLLDALKRIMEPPTKKKRPLSRRSVPLTVKTKPPSLPPKATDEEIQNLEFFTNYCKQRNNFVTYRSKLPDDFDLTF
ncbi:cilia- and flagella-associated protein 100-like [Nylanderia fulva]|uniref:cilia- and flagella-associated protein 100-like n=1 Tax=Nylanderia fulva TaxID=613905 RepID=UPI0010FB094A|nr:cilia- and flagella-associated protein 100-like [Nylanderia fulva]